MTDNQVLQALVDRIARLVYSPLKVSCSSIEEFLERVRLAGPTVIPAGEQTILITPVLQGEGDRKILCGKLTVVDGHIPPVADRQAVS